MDSEELRIYLRTVSDTRGVQQTEQSLRGFSNQLRTAALAAGGLAIGREVIQAYLDFREASLGALRDHQKELRKTIGDQAEMAKGIGALSKEYEAADKSGKALLVTMGRMFAPGELVRLSATRGAVEGLDNALKSASKWAAEMAKNPLFQGAMAASGVGLGGLVGPTLTTLARAGESIEQEEAARARIAAQERDRQQREYERQRARRRLELNEVFTPQRETAAEQGRVAFLDQLDAALRDLAIQQRQGLDLQREAVSLTAQEASLRLSMLPAQQQMAALQRDMTEQQLRARQGALPATEALEDLRFAQSRAELIARNRNVAVEDRIAARRELRGIGRAAPGVELGALEAERRLALVGRQAERFGIQQGLFDIGTQRRLAGVQGAQDANQLAQAIVQGIVQGQQQVVQQMLDANRGPLNLNVSVTLPDGSVVSYSELIEAEKQATGPSVIRVSGVRRS